MSLRKKITRRVSHVAEFLLMLPFVAIVSLLPFHSLEKAATVLYFIFYPILGSARKRVRDNLRLIKPDFISVSEKAFINKTLICFLRFFLEMMQAHKYEKPSFMKKYIRHTKQFEDYFANREGGICLAGHIGNYEIALAYVAGQGYRIAAVGKEMSNPYVNLLLNFFRRNYTSVILHPGDSTGLRRVMKQGYFLALVADQDGGPDGIFTDFLGVSASHFAGPPALGMMFKVDIALFTHIYKGKGIYELDVMSLIPGSALHRVGKDRQQAMLSITKQYADALAQVVREHPEEYLWAHRRWKSRPKSALTSS